MTKYVIAFKDTDGKWRIWAKVTSRARIAEKLESLYKYDPKIKVIQIQKVVE